MGKEKWPQERINDYWYLLQPNLPVMITSRNKDNGINVAPFGWNKPVSVDPPRLSVALVNSPPNQTLTNIVREKEFMVNVPTLQIAEKLVKASYQHPKGISKFDAIGFQIFEPLNIRTPGIAECRANIECRLFTTLNAGDHTLVLGDVVAVTFETDDYTEGGVLKMDKVWPALHLDQNKQDGGQVHSFVIREGTKDVFVPYNKR